ncbi:MAG: cytochrome c oxidase subunit I [Bacteroidota bacterium]|jgi:cytochrome c oxidase subunit 1|uniref:cytochrome c oxidase subunit I n=1 Tax=Candidatus Pollutiaquabacter sp. TaxID=3416354 RepID=UPI001A613E9C|nr:cbb3-type cytochrome c oxidase subunit I [Bacteroidota bacterium]MBL7948463.1 cbb3-type cytochrome c oxidase subunit I [Bacteroidia bacterium]MBP7270375.1 cbb3-type cytochrome c oxidase subunit I [Bacteroidia bacterium]MBP7728289.1 cbb3-type cytochrome c oxidase subunit I [Bacteroidia bacterium]MBP7772512.1 cbb3-type cytochrome c oxidase subunit I [Bacteroidia bacterium]
MSTHAHDHAHDAHHEGHDHHEHHDSFWTKYVFSQDHKMISKQFLVTAIVMAVLAMLMSLVFRLQLGWPDQKFGFLESIIGKWGKDGKLDPGFYLALVTIHGTIMVFFVLTGGLSGTFSNLLIPFQVGARDMASGFLNMLSYWFFFASCSVMTLSLFVEAGPASAGWTIYPPLSALPQAIPGSGLGMTLWLVSMVLFIASALLGGINYVVTILNLRTKGMSMTRLPLTIWAFFITAILGILSFPVLFAAALLLLFDRSFGTSFYLSDIFIDGAPLHNIGGSPVLFQHLFWFLGHPEVYIVLLPALGLASEVIATQSRKPIFGYKAMIGSMLVIAFLSFIVWGHHMFITGMNPFLGSVFVFTTLLVAIPSAVKVFNYLATLWRGNIVLTPAMLFAIGLVSFFISGGLTGIILGDSALDINVHDTYFVVAHFHIVMGSSAIFGMFAGIYHWFPRMFGRMMDKKLGYLHFWLTLVGVYGTFFPMHFIGLSGAPRRYYAYTAYEGFDAALNINVLVSIFAILGGLAQFIFVFNFFYSMYRGRKASQNPWKSNTLEWTAPVEHLHGNWPGEIPTVHRWAYDYGKPNADDDYIPQTTPYSQTTKSNLPGEG